jgi:protein-tyrosine phosphatase
MWRHGNALRPYFEDVKVVLKNKTKFSNLHNNPNVVVDESTVGFIHFPIKDCSVTDDTRVLQLALRLVEDIHNGEVLYLHCWGGHGRTGTLVSIMLHLMYGVSQLLP